MILKRADISYYWSVDSSYEFINKISDIKTARSIKTFDFCTLYTNLSLDVIHDSLRSLIIKMFANSKSVSIMVNSNTKQSFWSNGSNYAEYRDCTIDEFPEAFEMRFYSIPTSILMGVFSNKYLGWILVVMPHLLLSSYTYHGVNIAMWLKQSKLTMQWQNCYHIIADIVVDDKFVTGIYHKVDEFNFEVINYHFPPFPQSIINSTLGYTKFYSQLIRFSRLGNNINDFLFWGQN